MRLTVFVKLPNLTSDKRSKTSASSSGSGSAKAKTSMSGHQVESKLHTKFLEGTEDGAYSSEEESDDDRRGGRKILGLLKEVSKPCRRKGETKKMARCLGSKGKRQILYPKFTESYGLICNCAMVLRMSEPHGAGHEIESAY